MFLWAVHGIDCVIPFKVDNGAYFSRYLKEKLNSFIIKCGVFPAIHIGKVYICLLYTSEFNIQIFEDKGQSVEAFREAVESFPVMADRKLVLIRNSGIFQSAGEEMKAFWQDLFKNPPEYLALVFDEEKTDGRSVLVKKVKESGLLVEFRYKTQAELAQWAGKEFAKAGLQVQNDVLSQLVFSCDEGMENLSNEICLLYTSRCV